MLEKMDAFFSARLDGYDEHMLHTIEGAAEFYPYTVSLLPKTCGAKVLDLGCGTGLELEEYFRLNPDARVTGIDLTPAMLRALEKKFPDRDITLICGSYFDVPLGLREYDAAVSVESLHHFTAERKTALYKRLRAALKAGGYFVLTDYFAQSEHFERACFAHLEQLKREQCLAENAFYHWDTPLTVGHEMEALRNAGFSQVTLMRSWGATCTVVARS